VLDTTLRDGSQTYGISFTLQDKLSIAQRLDELGVRYIEGGWPSSNPKDAEFFKASKRLNLKHSKLVAFTSTRRKGVPPHRDENLTEVVACGVKTAVVFGKAWQLHVEKVLNIGLEENLELIRDSISYLRDRGLEVIFDAEHYFDGYKSNPSYALEVLKAAEEAGAHTLVLCDTNGGTLPQDIHTITQDSVKSVKSTIGIHAHNDAGLAVANTIVAVSAGARHIQGTINGLGERCGNADLCQVLPTLQFKMGYDVVLSDKPWEKRLSDLTALSQYVYDLANLPNLPSQPYVGKNAFKHKAGVHVDAVLKIPRAYEHIDPTLIGNVRGVSISELSGRASIVNLASEINLNLDKEDKLVNEVLKEVKKLEAEGYHFENAKASVHLILLRKAGLLTTPFRIISWKASSTMDGEAKCAAEVVVEVSGEVFKEEAKGVGPVHALDVAFKRAVLQKFPQLSNTKLINYKVTVIDSVLGTASVVRVFIEFEDNGRRWATTSVSANIIEASIEALAEGYTYKLALDALQKKAASHLQKDGAQP